LSLFYGAAVGCENSGRPSRGPGFEIRARDGTPAGYPTRPRRSPPSCFRLDVEARALVERPELPAIEALDNIQIPTFTNIDAPVPRGLLDQAGAAGLAAVEGSTGIRAGELVRIASTIALPDRRI